MPVQYDSYLTPGQLNHNLKSLYTCLPHDRMTVMNRQVQTKSGYCKQTSSTADVNSQIDES